MRCAFTLTELIVVTAIISILAALTIPAALRARVAADKTACASNLREIGLAMHEYAAVNRGLFPSYDWLPALRLPDELFRCPANGTEWDGTSYLAVLGTTPEDQQGRGPIYLRRMSLFEPSALMVGERPPSKEWGRLDGWIYETSLWLAESPIDPPDNLFWSRHQGGANWLRADGTVR